MSYKSSKFDYSSVQVSTSLLSPSDGGEESLASSSSCRIPRRYVYAFFVFLMVFVNYIMRVYVSVAIVPISEEYEFDAQTSGILLSCFYWGYIITQVPGGWLARKFGYKLLILVGVGGSSCLTLLLPHVVAWPAAFVAIRFLNGLCQGIVYPSAYFFMSEWAPKSEKGTIAALVSSAGAWGTVLSNGVSPLIVASYGWEYLAYAYGGAGLILLGPFLLFTRDTPEYDRTFGCLEVDAAERQYVLAHREKQSGAITSINDDERSPSPSPSPSAALKQAPKVPWVSILRHPAVIALYVMSFAGGWGWYVFLSWLPSYLKKHLGFDLQQTAFISLWPYLIRPLLVIGSGAAVDFLANRKICTLVTARKIFQAISAFLPATVLVVLSFSDPTPMVASFLIVAAVAAGGFDGGAVGNSLDLSAQYAPIIFALKNMAGAIPGVIGVYLTGWILDVTGHDWRVVFLLAAALYYISILVYALLAQAHQIDFDALERDRTGSHSPETDPLLGP